MFYENDITIFESLQILLIAEEDENREKFNSDIKLEYVLLNSFSYTFINLLQGVS